MFRNYLKIALRSLLKHKLYSASDKGSGRSEGGRSERHKYCWVAFDRLPETGVDCAVLASPLAWWALDKWLGTFAYKTELTWWIFGVAGVLAVVIAFLTVSYQSIKAATMNPVTSLRSE